MLWDKIPAQAKSKNQLKWGQGDLSLDFLSLNCSAK